MVYTKVVLSDLLMQPLFNNSAKYGEPPRLPVTEAEEMIRLINLVDTVQKLSEIMVIGWVNQPCVDYNTY